MSVGSDYHRKLTALHPVTKRFYATLGIVDAVYCCAKTVD